MTEEKKFSPRRNFYRLCQYLKTHKIRLEKQRPSTEQIRREVQRVLGFRMHHDQLRDAKEETGVAWEARPGRSSATALVDRVHYLEFNVNELWTNYKNLVAWTEAAQERLSELEAEILKLTGSTNNGVKRQ